MQKHLEEKLIPALPATYEDGSPCPVPQKICWYPEGLAWNMRSDRKAIKSLPAYAQFHDWLKAAMENGDISRQEAVSMIPPLLLDVRPEHLVLDLCAAPGSKTAQLVEQMHKGCEPGEMPTGLVIANDLDQKRAYLLHHQVKRILSPCLMVTNNDGTLFPNLYAGDSEEQVQFDRILADVPCSGDGTVRKNPGVWREWTVGNGLGLHPLQVRLLERAIAMTKVGGRIVYSTCSMNPVEDEAVIAAVLHKLEGKVKLVDCSQELEGLVRLPGVSSWKIMSKDGSTAYESHSEIPPREQSRYPLSSFPLPEYNQLGLERCMRVLPHLQDTGGFFIAVLEKIEETKTQFKKVSPTENPLDMPLGFAKNPHEGDFKIIDPDTNASLSNILTSYGMNKPLLDRFGCSFISKSQTEPLKLITIISKTARRLLQGPNENLKVVNLGARAFEHYDVNSTRQFGCPYRVLSESAALFDELSIIQERRVQVGPQVLRSLINSDDSVPLEQCILESAELERVKAYGEGGMMLVAEAPSGQIVVVPAWKGDKSLKAFVPKANRPAILYQLA